MESINSTIRKNGAAIGIYLGAFLLLLSVGSYYYITRLTESFFMIAIGSNIIKLIFEILSIVLVCTWLRSKIGGFWSFRQAVSGIFIMFAVAYFIQIVGYDMLFSKLIDKNVNSNIHNAWTNTNLKTLKQGADPKIVKHRQELIDDTYAKQNKSDFSVIYVIQNLLITIIISFVISLIFAALFKREQTLNVTS